MTVKEGRKTKPNYTSLSKQINTIPPTPSDQQRHQNTTTSLSQLTTPTETILDTTQPCQSNSVFKSNNPLSIKFNQSQNQT